MTNYCTTFLLLLWATGFAFRFLPAFPLFKEITCFLDGSAFLEDGFREGWRPGEVVEGLSWPPPNKGGTFLKESGSLHLRSFLIIWKSAEACFNLSKWAFITCWDYCRLEIFMFSWSANKLSFMSCYILGARIYSWKLLLMKGFRSCFFAVSILSLIFCSCCSKWLRFKL